MKKLFTSLSEKLGYRPEATNNDIQNNINFNTCHPTWQTRSIDLNPVNLSNSAVYSSIAIPALIFNVLVVGHQLGKILAKDIHDSAVWDSNSKVSSTWTVFKLVSSLIASLLDSVFDALYFIKLKTIPRMIHVPKGIHIVQGGLLYLGELFLLFKNVTSF